jgi:hypothetical protein
MAGGHAGRRGELDKRERRTQLGRAAQGDADAFQRSIIHYHAVRRGGLAAGIDPAVGRRGRVA